MKTFVLFLLAVTVASACGDDAKPERSSETGAGAVMVIDDGIDTSLDLFQGKIVATYTIECSSSGTQEDAGPDPSDPFGSAASMADGGTTTDAQQPSDRVNVDASSATQSLAFSEAKAAFIAQLAEPDESCHLKAGIAPVPAFLTDLETSRDGWNHDVLGDVDISNNPLYQEIITRLDGKGFHGTATAGIIAYDNPQVHLVLVGTTLATSDEIAQSIHCPTQAELDFVTALLTDSDVVSAYANRPRSAQDRAIAQAMIDHNVRLVNQSYGRISRHGLAKVLDTLHCGDLDLGGYFAALNQLDRTDDNDLPAPDALVLKAAGNDSAALNSPSDSLDCRLGSTTLSLIGSYDVDGSKSSFTNFGDCVDLFAPGSLVAAPLPGNWWMPLSGTSFAAPLVTRLASMMAPSPFSSRAAQEALHALRRPDRSIPRPRFPEPLLYLPGVPSPLALTLEMPKQTPYLEDSPLTNESLHGTLWPLKWLQGRR